MNHVDPVYTQKGFNRLMFVLTISGGIVWIVCIALWVATARPTELLSEFVGEASSEGGYSIMVESSPPWHPCCAPPKIAGVAVVD